ncbi:GTP cyclohydrolase [Microbispora sp. H10949]|uniref:GTP cyclohydrolase n=1 Tax=Microbispora sp. H10949 TaxID=2729111 RepID=UPI001600CE0C|nr:GTP cyclohydrolase [Microbispora sp. H10949]
MPRMNRYLQDMERPADSREHPDPPPVRISNAIALRIADRTWYAACVRDYDPDQGHTGTDHLLLLYTEAPPPPKGMLPALPPGDLPFRIHSECLFGDVFSGDRCDCGGQLDAARRDIVAHGHGMIFYLRQEGRGIGLFDKVRSLLQDGDTYQRNLAVGAQEDARRYDLAARVLLHLGVGRVRLMSGNPEKGSALTRAGIEVSLYTEIDRPLSHEAAGEVSAKMARGYSYSFRGTFGGTAETS